jgi:hypothetical protein
VRHSARAVETKSGSKLVLVLNHWHTVPRGKKIVHEKNDKGNKRRRRRRRRRSELTAFIAGRVVKKWGYNGFVS